VLPVDLGKEKHDSFAIQTRGLFLKIQCYMSVPERPCTGLHMHSKLLYRFITVCNLLYEFAPGEVIVCLVLLPLVTCACACFI
jgi:hypothetical protein